MFTGPRTAADDRPAHRAGGESGFTLIELMLSLALMAIILAATAGSLITFTRTSAENERRVQATSILNEVQEAMHAAPWEVLGVYENELDVLDEVGTLDTAADPATLDGEVLAELPAWDDGTCSWTTFEEAVACGREHGTPRTRQVVDRDGWFFTVYNAVTWIDRSGDGIADVKRLTSVARWELLGRTYQERFVSERAPTNIEAGDPQRPRLIQLDLAPRTATLTDQHRLPGDVEVGARFTAGVQRAEARFYVVDTIQTEQVETEPDSGVYETVITGATLREESVELTGIIPDPEDATKWIAFRGSIPVSAGWQFTDGPRAVRAVGTDGTEEYAGSRTLDLTGEIPHEPDPGDSAPADSGDEPAGDTTPLVIDSTPAPTTLNVTLANDSGSRLFCQDLTIAAYVSGLNPEDTSSVTVSYTVGSEQVTNRPLTASADPITGTNDRFSYTFAAGADHGFRHGDETTFDVHVERISGGEATALGDEVVSFANATGGAC